MTIAQAPGKFIVCGEHAVIWGGRVLSIPTTRGIEVHLHQRPSKDAHIEFADDVMLYIDRTRIDAGIRHFFARLCQKIGVDPERFRYHVRCDIPIGAGLGTSAALSVAMINALRQETGMALTDDAACQIAFEMESEAHGVASGIDVYTSFYRRPIYWHDSPIDSLTHLHPHVPTQRLSRTPMMSEKACWLILHSGTTISTSDMVQAQTQSKKKDARLISAYQQLSLYTGEIVDALESDQFHDAGRCMNRAHQCLAELGLSTPQLDELHTQVSAYGAWGAKLSGGGGGGILVALFEDNSAAKNALQSFTQHGIWGFLQQGYRI